MKHGKCIFPILIILTHICLKTVYVLKQVKVVITPAFLSLTTMTAYWSSESRWSRSLLVNCWFSMVFILMTISALQLIGYPPFKLDDFGNMPYLCLIIFLEQCTISFHLKKNKTSPWLACTSQDWYPINHKKINTNWYTIIVWCKRAKKEKIKFFWKKIQVLGGGRQL